MRSSQSYLGNAQEAMGTVKYRKLHLNTREKLVYCEGGLKKRTSRVSILSWRIPVNFGNATHSSSQGENNNIMCILSQISVTLYNLDIEFLLCISEPRKVSKIPKINLSLQTSCYPGINICWRKWWLVYQWWMTRKGQKWMEIQIGIIQAINVTTFSIVQQLHHVTPSQQE